MRKLTRMVNFKRARSHFSKKRSQSNGNDGYFNWAYRNDTFNTFFSTFLVPKGDESNQKINRPPELGAFKFLKSRRIIHIFRKVNLI